MSESEALVPVDAVVIRIANVLTIGSMAGACALVGSIIGLTMSNQWVPIDAVPLVFLFLLSMLMLIAASCLRGR